MAEDAGWFSYESRLVPLFAVPFLPVILDAIDQTDPELIVDVACGTGATARGLRDAYPRARIIGVDFDLSAIGLARTRSPGDVMWLGASATALPFQPASVDVLVYQQGLQFISWRQGARAAATALRPSGQLVGLCWCPRLRQPVFAALHELASRFGWGDPTRFDGPCSFDPERFAAAAQKEGLSDVQIAEISLTLPISDPRDLLRHWYDYPTAALAKDWQRASDEDRSHAEAMFAATLSTPPNMHAFLVTARAPIAN